MNPQEDVDEMYVVVRNHEEQYSIWSATQPLPAGWTIVGTPAFKEICLDRIADIWTDMRPASLRKAMEATAGGQER